MNHSVYRISLDIHDMSSQVSISVKRGDTCRRICAVLTDNSKPYSIAEGCTAVFRMRKPADAEGKRAVVFNDCTIENNAICYTINAENTEIVGIADCEFSLYAADKQLITSPHFTVVVDKRVVDDGEIETVGHNEVTKLTELISEVEKLKEDISTGGGGGGGSVDVSGKVDKVPEATGGHLAVFVEPEGGIADCGIPCSKVVTTDNIGEHAPTPEYATAFKAGVVKIGSYSGLKMGTDGSAGFLHIDQAPEGMFSVRSNGAPPMPITIGNVDFAVKTCLTDGKQVVTWSDEEKQAARALLGAATIETQDAVSTLDSKVGDISSALDAILAMQSAIIGGEV